MNKIYDSDSELDMNISGFFDPMTRIANRNRFDTMLAREIERAKNIISYLSILLIDIDCFQNFSGDYGKQCREKYLHQVAITLRGCFNRSGDLAARWGDAKFVCLLTDTDYTGAAQMAAKVRKAVSDLNIPHKEASDADVITVSIGVTTALLTDETSCEELLQKAVQALIRAQNLGDNQIYIWEK